MPEPSLWAVILAGGVGSRFWPVSTPDQPKQLLPLAGPSPLILQTVERIRPLVPDARIRILTGERLAKPILGAVPGLDDRNLFVEPRARGTAPVLAWAAHQISNLDPDAVLLSLHADHVIEPADRFRSMLARVADAALGQRRLFTIGAPPSRAETGYGYIRAGNPIGGDDGLLDVAEFVEKPDAGTALRYVAEGFLWNTGLFVLPASLLLEELRRHTPEVAEHLSLLDEGRTGDFFDRCPSLTIDVGLLERSDRVAVARATFDWDDIGTWDAVARTRDADARGNVMIGNAHAVESERCIAWSDEGAVVVFGGSDLVVVRTSGITFVMPRDRAADLKQLFPALPESLSRPGGSG